MVTINGKTYEYKEILPDGNVIYGNRGKYITDEQRDRLNEIMSRAWDALPEIDKKEINMKMELKYGKEGAS